MNVYIAGNYTLNFLSNELRKITEYEINFGEYSKYQQDFMVGNSEYNLNKYDFTLLTLDGDVLLSRNNIEEIEREIIDIVEAFVNKKNTGYLILSNIYFSLQVNSELNYNSKSNVKLWQLRVNSLLNDIAVENKNIFIFDYLSIVEKYGEANIFDNDLWIYSKNRLNKIGLKVYAQEFVFLLNSILGNRKKCLVLDLDNTLWGGIVGEDKIGGIQLSSDGVGSVYQNFQREILKIKNKGILLAINSKNNLEDAKKIFDEHTEMILKWEDFSVKKINWELKNTNIQEIAKELNIDESSLVFIDDNPIEREIVNLNTRCIVPEFPKSVSSLAGFIVDVDKRFFSSQHISLEDLHKTEQYQENQQRNEYKNNFDSYVDYINTLGVVISIYKNNGVHTERAAQMTQKTNQFNLSTKRYSSEDIKGFLISDDYDVYTGAVKDKFGDFGVVILAIIKYENNNKLIDTLLMSCRVIGRHVENIFLREILKSDYFCKAEYIKTNKNILIEKFIKESGFSLVREEGDGKLYELKGPVKTPFNLKVKVEYE